MLLNPCLTHLVGNRVKNGGYVGAKRYIDNMRRIAGIILVVAGLDACTAIRNVSPPPPELAVPRPAHHSMNGGFDNTDTAGGLRRDTVRSDSLVSAHRTRMSPLPIARGHEEWWQDSSQATATWIGHSTYYLRWQGLGVLTDPIFSMRASPVPFAGPKRVTPPGRSLDSLPGVDLVLISHDHYDHLDKPSIDRIHELYPRAVFAAPLGVGALLRSWGIPDSLVRELDWWESTPYQGLTLTCAPVHHTSRRGIFKSSAKKTLWGSWLVEWKGRRIWFAGDLGMGNGNYYEELARRAAPLDLALLPIGGYLPARYTSVHISPRQAVELHRLTRSRLSLAGHWGAFGMTFEEMEDPPKDLRDALITQGVDSAAFRAPLHGELVRLPW